MSANTFVKHKTWQEIQAEKKDSTEAISHIVKKEQEELN